MNEGTSKQAPFWEERTCGWCQTPFWARRCWTKKFCTHRCGLKHVASLKVGKKRPDSAARMRNNNPMKDQAVRDRMVKTKTANGTLREWKGERGGNGKTTPQQQKLFESLASQDPRWCLEFVILTGRPKKDREYPTCYKVDIGLPEEKLAVEVDGPTHRTRRGRDKDMKKDRLLASLGWRVLRFWNEEIDSEPTLVLKLIHSSIASK